MHAWFGIFKRNVVVLSVGGCWLEGRCQRVNKALVVPICFIFEVIPNKLTVDCIAKVAWVQIKHFLEKGKMRETQHKIGRATEYLLDFQDQPSKANLSQT